MRSTDAVARVNSKSLREQVYELLKAEMNEGRLSPGAFLDLAAIETRLGVSRTPLREAFLQLASEGFVTIKPRRGILVNQLTLDEIRHIYEVIGALESTAILGAGSKLGARQVARMKRLNAAMRAALDRDDFAAYYEANLAFHDVYLGLSDNPMLLRTVRLLKERLYDFPRRKGFVKEWEVASTGEHAAVVERLQRGDLGAAAEYVRDVHWSFAVQERFIHLYYFTSRANGHAASAPETTRKERRHRGAR